MLCGMMCRATRDRLAAAVIASMASVASLRWRALSGSRCCTPIELHHLPLTLTQNPLVERVIAIFDDNNDGEVDFKGVER